MPTVVLDSWLFLKINGVRLLKKRIKYRAIAFLEERMD
jgi:hypothetical protein